MTTTSSFTFRMLCCCLLVFPSCQALNTAWNGTAEAQIPRWYLDGRSSEYPSPMYIVGVGEGSNPEDAAGQARASVGAQLRVQIDSEITSITRELDSGDQYTFETIFNNATTSRIDEQLQGLETALQSEHAGRYYALAALNRQRYLGELESGLDRLRDRHASLIENGRQQIGDGHVFAGITSFMDAQNLSTDFYATLSTFNALADRPYASGDVLGMAGLIPEIRSARTAIRISMVSGDDQTGSAGRQLPEPMVFRASYTGGDSEVPMPNLPLRIEYQDGSEAERTVTGHDGQASVYLTALPVRREVNQVVIQPVFTEIPSNYRNIVRNLSLRATYRISQEDRIPVSVRITDDSGQRIGQLEQRIGSIVEQLGYSVSEGSGVVLDGTVHQMDVREVDGLIGRQTVVRSELQLTVKNLGSNAVIGSLSGLGTGMSPRSETEALRASRNRVDVDRRELAEVLSGVTAEMAASAGARAARQPARPARTPSGPPSTPETTPAGSGITRITIDDMTFELQSAEMTQDNRVIIIVQVTNNDYRDRQVRFIRRSTEMYDQLGHSHDWPILGIGSNSVSGNESSLNHLLISEVPVTLTLEFREVAPSTESIALLTIAAGRTRAQLRNFPLVKQ